MKTERISFKDEEGEYAYLIYSDDEVTLTITKTFVSNKYRGQGIAAKLVEELIRIATEKKRFISSTCSYGITYFEKHPNHIYKPVHDIEVYKNSCPL